MEFTKKNIKIILGIITFAIVLFSASQNLSTVFGFLNSVLKIFSPIIIGLCMAFVLNVLMRLLENKVFGFMARSKRRAVRKAQRTVSLVSTMLIAVGLVALVLLIVIPDLRDSIVMLFNNIPSYAETIAGWIERAVKYFGLDINTEFLHNPRIDWTMVAATAQKYLSFENTGNIVDTTVGVTSSVISGFTNFFLGLVIAVYVLAQKEKIGKFFHRISNILFPEKIYNKCCEICSIASNSFSSFITGQFTDATLLGTMCFIGMTIFRFPSAAVIAVVIGVSAVIPVIGPIIGEAFGILLIAIESPLQALLFWIFMIILQAIDNNFIYPKIVGKSVGLPGILVLAAVIVGGNLGGIFGILVGVPTVSAIYAITLDWLSTRERSAKAAFEANADDTESEHTIETE